MSTPVWSPNTFYPQNAIVEANGGIWQAIVPGESGAVPPIWPSGVLTTGITAVSDYAVMWLFQAPATGSYSNIYSVTNTVQSDTILVPHDIYLFNQINENNNIVLDPTQYTISSPTAYSNSSNPLSNTQVTISPIPLNGYVGDVTIYYQRIDISTVLNAQTATFNLANLTMLSDLLPQINTAYNLDLLASDIVDTALPVANPTYPNAALVVAIQTTGKSLKYTGSYNYTLNYTQVQSSIPTDSRRVIVVYRGIATVANSIVKYNLDASIDTTFKFANNVSNITTFNITIAFYRADGTIVLLGNFVCTVLIANIATPGTFTSLTIDQTGSVTQYTTTVTYAFTTNAKLYTNRYSNYVYALDTTLPVPQCLVRYTEAGIVDDTFNYGGNYLPDMIRVTDSGTIYTVSGIFSAQDPYNTNTSIVNMVRIDRLLASGVIDTSFNTVYIRASVNSATIPFIVDIKENPNGLIAILLSSQYYFAIGEPTVVVNGVNIVPYDSNGNSLYTWIPIISLLANGSLNPQFNNYISLNSFSNGYVVASGSALETDADYLVYTASQISFVINKVNPINALEFMQPMRFNIDGSLSLYNSNEYMNLPIYSSVVEAIGYNSDGTMVLDGVLLPISINGTQSASRDLISIVNSDGTVAIISNPQTGVGPNGTVSVLQTFCF